MNTPDPYSRSEWASAQNAAHRRGQRMTFGCGVTMLVLAAMLIAVALCFFL